MPRPRGERYSIAATPKAPIRIPLNDDGQEKANRLQQRKAAQEAHLQSIRASATPKRGRLSGVGIANSPHTPLNEDDMPNVTGQHVTPAKHAVPLQANFEEWMRLAKDNKINANNSWNFALIDYFHDMSLLKQGDGVDFQKASTTLDGCVKIYTSRVDSVADDTGKLLNGLAENSNKKRRGDDADGDEEGDEEEGEEGEDGQKKRKKRGPRTAEATLAASFEQLQNKKVDSELGVDPLFKKASADFDEGGAKGLLLNHLHIDSKGRIIFDSSDDLQDAPKNHRGLTPAPGLDEVAEEEPEDEEEEPSEDVEIDLSGLARKYLPDLARLDGQDVCPSLKDFNIWDADSSLDLPFLNPPDDWRKNENNDDGDGEEVGNQSGLFLDEDNHMGFDDDEGDMGVDLPEPGFGEGGEVWARDAAIESQGRVHIMGLGEGDDDVRESTEGAEEGAAGADGYQYGLSISHGRPDEQENILSYFDNALHKNWAGPEHWRIRRIKDDTTKAAPVTKRKEKEPFEIDFLAPMNQAMADALYIQAASNSAISMPKAQWTSKTRNLLPDDKHFNSKRLIRLFLKPKAQLGGRGKNPQKPSKGAREGEVDEGYFANPDHEANADKSEAPQGDYDANFFQDDGLDALPQPFDDDDDDQFADAREHFTPTEEDAPGLTQALDGVLRGTQDDAFGANLVSQNKQFKPMYMQNVAKTAKRVDVRRLKENLWYSLGLEEIKAPPQSQEDPAIKAVDGSLKLTNVMTGLTGAYKGQQLADLSTSFCFICLLHLANEKGLEITNTDNFEDLTIRKDFSADLTIGD